MPKRKTTTEKETGDLPQENRDSYLAVSSPLPSVTHDSFPQAIVQPLEGDGAIAAKLDPDVLEAMPNFLINPLALILEGMAIDQGPADRKIRTMMVVPPLPPLQHDRVIIAETNNFVPI